MRTQPKAVETITGHLGGNPHVERVILYGSRARGDEEERSDIDLAVAGAEITSAEWNEMLRYVEEEAPTLLSVDLVRLEEVSQRLRDNIEREGVTLYERK